MKKKILLFINDLKGNGAERVVITLAEKFLEKGFSPAIICFKKDVQLPVKNEIPISVFSQKLFRWIPRRVRGIITAPFLDLFIKINFGKPDLILSNLIPADRILAYSKLENVYFIVHSITSIEVTNYYAKNYIQEINERKRVYGKKPCICVSEGVKKDLESLIKNHKHGIHKIYNGINLKQVLEASLAKPDDLVDDCIIHVGKFNTAKRQDKLIKAYHVINCKYPLVFIGRGPKLEEAKQLVRKLNLTKKVHFLGFKKNPFPYVRKSRLMILCSDFEGLGMVILESICLKTPVISSDCPSGPSEILPIENLFQKDSEEEFTELLKNACDNPEKYYSELKDEFNIDHAVERYISLIK